jgi:DNA-directed RNA polymerase specialized sigma24 family protein
MRSQAAPLPSLLATCAQAYAQGNTLLAETLLPNALQETTDAIQATIHKRGVPIHEHDDIHQETLIRIIRQLKRGICPTITTVTYHTIVDAYRKQHTTGRSRQPKPRTVTLDAVAETIDEHADTEYAALHAVDDSADPILHRLAARNPLLALIAQYSIDGLTPNQIATTMSVSRAEIRIALDEIRIIIETAA